MADLIDRAIEDSGCDAIGCAGVGAARAIIDPVSGVISAGPETPSWSPEWANFDVRGELA
ncbi:MAG: hypothetical protein R2855_18005 [Thermomicrobiales bacterium]